MRQLFFVVMAVSAFATTYHPAMAADAGKPAAVSAERYGVKASYSAPAEHGYSAEARRITDCLATYRTYDVRTDRVEVRPGVSRRCSL